jgi:hypothetical protein
MVKKIRVYVELCTDDIVDVPESVTTEEELENFVSDFAMQNTSAGYEFLEEQISFDEFLDEVQKKDEEAKKEGCTGAKIVIVTNLENTYEITGPEKGSYVVNRHTYDHLEDAAEELYESLSGNVTKISLCKPNNQKEKAYEERNKNPGFASGL